MRKITVSLFIVAAVMAFCYCSSSKKASAPMPVVVKKVNYQSNVMGILQASCTPCHFPDKGGNKKPLDTYAAVTAQSDEILRRIQLNPTERGFMPSRHPKLSDSTITVLKQWKADGLTEK